MKLGFFTAALPGNTLEQAARWGAESGFQAIEIACWPLEVNDSTMAGDFSRARRARLLSVLLPRLALAAPYPNPALKVPAAQAPILDVRPGSILEADLA